MSESKTSKSTYDKKTYWERRKKGLRGQGDKTKRELAPKESIGGAE